MDLLGKPSVSAARALTMHHHLSSTASVPFTISRPSQLLLSSHKAYFLSPLRTRVSPSPPLSLRILAAADGGADMSGQGGLLSSSPPPSPSAHLPVSSRATSTPRSVAAGAGPGGGPSTMVRNPSSPADVRTEKLMKMQKELLEQLEERRKLHAALLKSMDDPAGTIKAFNESDRAGLPPLGKSTAGGVATPNGQGRPLVGEVGKGVRAAGSPLTQTPQPPLSAASRVPAPPPPAPAGGAQSPLGSIPLGASTTLPPPKANLAAPALGRAPVSTAKPAQAPVSVPIPSAPPSRQWSSTADDARVGGPSPAASPGPAAAKAAPGVAASAPASAASRPKPKAPFAPPPARAMAPPPSAAAPVAAPAAPAKAPAFAPPRTAPLAPPIAPPRVETPPPPAPAPPAPAPPAVAKAKVEAQQPPVEEPPAPLAGPNVMNIVMVASECAPWSKTGGLGDVVGALPKALAKRGHRVMVCVPRYRDYQEAVDTTVRKRYNVAGQDMEVGYFHHYSNNVDWVFIDHNMFHHLPNIYAGSREEVQKRMVLLCKAAIEAPWHVPCGGVCYGDGNLVFVANDWHTALLPVYLQAYYRDHGLMEFARSMLVIHNMAHQGRAPVAEYKNLGLPEHFLNRFKLYDPIGGEHMNIFMAGIISAHRIVAVSHGYAWEIQTQMGGWGLDAVLRDHNAKLRGVVNGIDTNEWSPEVDPHLKADGYVNYSAETLEKKAQCKAALQRELGLPERPDVPLLGFIGRLDYQKGVDIIGEAMNWITSQDCQLVLLGTGRHDLEDMLRKFEGSHKERVRGWVGFSVQMAHRITAGSDILLMPSRFEPCGLNQLYAMRYGTVPVVHAVGGLRDTVQQFDPFQDTGLGWTFDKAEAGGLIHALGNAMYTYRDFKDSWKKLQLRAMGQDLSWDNAAAQYEEVLVQAKYTW